MQAVHYYFTRHACFFWQTLLFLSMLTITTISHWCDMTVIIDRTASKLRCGQLTL